MANSSMGKGINAVLFMVHMVASLGYCAIIYVNSMSFLSWVLNGIFMNKVSASRRRSAGFSLMELLIVIVIIGVLMGVAVVNLQDTPNQARTSAAEQEIRTISTALEMYQMHNSRYPTSDMGLKALVEKPGESAKRWQKGGYLKGKKIPLDPWDNPYRYLHPGNNGEFDVYSLGPDGRESDDDIVSWKLD